MPSQNPVNSDGLGRDVSGMWEAPQCADSGEPLSPPFSHQVVTKRRKGRPDKARREEAPASVLASTLRRLNERNTVRTDHCADAVERV